MKSRIVGLVLLASMILLVGVIPAAGAQSPTQRPAESQALSWREAAAAGKAAPQPETSAQPEAPPLRNERRAERHPHVTRRPIFAPPPAAAPTRAGQFSIAAEFGESEPNDDWTTADAIVAGDVATGVIDPGDDVDYYAITVAGPDVLQFNVFANTQGSELDPLLVLYDTDGVSEIAWNDDYNRLDPQLIGILPAAGTYYLMVRDFYDDRGGPDYWYELAVIDPLAAGTALINASVDGMGREGNSFSFDMSISADGRYVAFASFANNLVPHDWNEATDIFVRDTQTNTIERISIHSDGTESNEFSYAPSISGDGRFVVFESYADNLVDDDFNDTFSDIFLHDRQTDETTLISRHSDGTQGDDESYGATISADGQFVVYMSYAENLVDDDDNLSADLFLFNVATGETTLISRHSDGTQGNDYSAEADISADGSVVAYSSWSDNLVDDDANGNLADVFIYDVASGTTTLVSRHSSGEQANNDSFDPAISADGKVITYFSFADNLVDGDLDGEIPDVFVHYLETGVTELVSRHSDGTPGNWDSYEPEISSDGRYVVFYSFADNLIDVDANGTVSDVFLHDLQTGETTLVSQTPAGIQSDEPSFEAEINADGTVIAYVSESTNLIPFSRTGEVANVLVRYTGLAEVYAISGLVLEEPDIPTCCALVRDISGAAAYADNFGNYYLIGLLAGEHGVWARDEGYYNIFPETPVPVTLPPSAFNVDIVGVNNEVFTNSYAATADAYVDQGRKSKNFGQFPYLRVRNDVTDQISYLQFDVDGLGACSKVNWSLLELFARNGGPDGGEVYRTSHDWTEAGITWTNAPPLGEWMDYLGSVYRDEPLNAVVDVSGNGAFSVAIRNESSNLVQYDSREGANPPRLDVNWMNKPEETLDATFIMDSWLGIAPLTVQFTDQTTGCPTSWEWDFGDGHTSDEPNPTHTFTEPGIYAVHMTVSNSKGADRKTFWIEVVEPPQMAYLSLSRPAVVDGLTIQPADIVAYDKANDAWQMVYDGSAHGTNTNVSSFTFDEDDLLLVFSANQAIAGLGTATPFDVVRFTPDDPANYPLGSGVFSWDFRGKPLGLSKPGERIDALANWFGIPAFSAVGKVELPADPVLKAVDEDIFAWDTFVEEWVNFLALDGSVVPGLAAEDVNGVWHDPWTFEFYITISGQFDLGGVTGGRSDIVRLIQGVRGYEPAIYEWLAPGATFNGNIDAIELSR